jgi:hypothetical protein
MEARLRGSCVNVHGRVAVVNDTVLTYSCPYCMVEFMQFRPLTSYKDGRFVCRDCAHTLRPGEPKHKCSCRNCLGVEAPKKSMFPD